jgi:hypothetical protein
MWALVLMFNLQWPAMGMPARPSSTTATTIHGFRDNNACQIAGMKMMNYAAERGLNPGFECVKVFDKPPNDSLQPPR